MDRARLGNSGRRRGDGTGRDKGACLRRAGESIADEAKHRAVENGKECVVFLKGKQNDRFRIPFFWTKQ